MRRLLALLTATGASRYLDKLWQGETLGCPVHGPNYSCSAGVACEETEPWTESRLACLRKELLMDTPLPMPGRKYVIVKQAGFGMANSMRGSVSAGVMLAALTNRRIIVDWGDLTRNFGAMRPLRLTPDRAPEPYEWWLDANSTEAWSETGAPNRVDITPRRASSSRLDARRCGTTRLQRRDWADTIHLVCAACS